MSGAQNEKTSRREALVKMFQKTGLLGIGGLAWGMNVNKGKAADLVLRPPGALQEKDFQKACIKCGICVDDCPYDTLKLANKEDHAPIGTPFFIPREIPCYMCTDIPCVKGCPTDALSEKLLFDQETGVEVMNINESEMGIAVLDQNNCVAFWGIRCDACYRACPLIDEALTIKTERNERTGRHAMLKPVVHADYCTGCGMCEHACITEKASIVVLPREVALGKVNEQYIKGWEEGDEQRIDAEDVYEDENEVDQSTLDYLNNTQDLFDE